MLKKFFILILLISLSSLLFSQTRKNEISLSSGITPPLPTIPVFFFFVGVEEEEQYHISPIYLTYTYYPSEMIGLGFCVGRFGIKEKKQSGLTGEEKKQRKILGLCMSLPLRVDGLIINGEAGNYI